MLARDLFGPVADQRVLDRITEIEHERRNDLAIAPAASVTWQSTRPLTIGEREVLRQVASERSDQHIARGLNISRKAASSHLANILRKLGVRQRTAAIVSAKVTGDG